MICDRQFFFNLFRRSICPYSSVHLRAEDKMNLRIGREGGLQSFELLGMLTLKISNEDFGKIKIHLDNNANKSIQLQTHPNVDKELFRSANQIGLKNPTKPFPANTDVGILKWRYQTQDESAIPLTSKILFDSCSTKYRFFPFEIYNIVPNVFAFDFQSIVGHHRTVKADAM